MRIISQTLILNSTGQIVMIDRIFVDSNVWVYLFKSDDIRKNTIAKRFFTDIRIREIVLLFRIK